MDLALMVIHAGGRERTLDEYRALIEKAGFQFSKVSPIRLSSAVIEATANEHE
jgi:hypothetical protein